MASQARILHAARCRLDVAMSGFRGRDHLPNAARVRLEDASLDSFDRLIEQAIEDRVDAVLLVGETVRAGDRSLRARRRLEAGLSRLDRGNIACVIACGGDDSPAVYRGMALPESTGVLSPRHPAHAVETEQGRLNFCLVSDEEPDTGRVDSRDINIAVLPSPADRTSGADAGELPDLFTGRGRSGGAAEYAYIALGGGRRVSTDVGDAVLQAPGALSPTSTSDVDAGSATRVDFFGDGAVRTRPIACSPVICRTLELSTVGVASVEDLAEAMSEMLPEAVDGLTVLTWRLSGGGSLAASLTADTWREAVELADDAAGQNRIHRYVTPAAAESPDEIAAMLAEEYRDRLGRGDLDPRDEFEEVPPGDIADVLAEVAADPETMSRAMAIGAAAFSGDDRPLWDAA